MASPAWPAAVRSRIVHAAQSGLVDVTSISRRFGSAQCAVADRARVRDCPLLTLSLWRTSFCGLRRESATWIPRGGSLGRRGRSTQAVDGAERALPPGRFDWRERKPPTTKCRLSVQDVNGRSSVDCHVCSVRLVQRVPIVVAGTTTSLPTSFCEELLRCAPRRPRLVVAAAVGDGRKREADEPQRGPVTRGAGKQAEDGVAHRARGKGGESVKLAARQVGGRGKAGAKRQELAVPQEGIIELAKAREFAAGPAAAPPSSAKTSSVRRRRKEGVPLVEATEVATASGRRPTKSKGDIGAVSRKETRETVVAAEPRGRRQSAAVRGTVGTALVLERRPKQGEERLQSPPPVPSVLSAPPMERKRDQPGEGGGVDGGEVSGRVAEDGCGGEVMASSPGSGGASSLPAPSAKQAEPSPPRYAEGPPPSAVAEIMSIVGARLKKRKKLTPETEARLELDLWSKQGDLVGALSCFDRVVGEGRVPMLQYHYNVLLHLCSSAATGTVRKGGRDRKRRELGKAAAATDRSPGSPVAAVNGGGVDASASVSPDDVPGKVRANGGEDERTSRASEVNGKWPSGNCAPAAEGLSLSPSPALTDLSAKSPASEESPSPSASSPSSSSSSSSYFLSMGAAQAQEAAAEHHYVVLSPEELAKLGMERGFELYTRMLEEGIKPNEATFTSMARLAAAKGDGDMAFGLIKQMGEVGILPRLRSYQPALSAYCNEGCCEKAWEVYEHMNNYEVEPSENDLSGLLDVAVRAGVRDKVYAVLHRLRTSVKTIRPETAEVAERWFTSEAAAGAEGISVERGEEGEVVRTKMEETGGGWHGLGWLGEGEWSVGRTTVSEEGVCAACGEQLATIDLDPVETAKFAQAVADLAMKRENKPNEFVQFQEWLSRNGPFDAVVDGANVGLFNSPGGRAFIYKQVHVVMDAMKEKSPSGKLPLLMLHKRRVYGGPGEQEMAKAAFQRYKDANVLYPTPTGSNDDWYWLFAAVKMGAFLVTNDEMRDHLFQLLGDNYFPKWKERHQVRFSVYSSVPKFFMPPPFSTCIQETSHGGWHLPITTPEEIAELDRSEEEDDSKPLTPPPPPREWVCAHRRQSGTAKHPDPMDWSSEQCCQEDEINTTNGPNAMHTESVVRAVLDASAKVSDEVNEAVEH